ncbi:DUF1192 domain-containing protein [Maritalea sp.]|uniref:DUF1192 domain-containing protein n=1 Tax=Maritalea sp. TaxID=2003361 RepID=UPI003EF0D9E6
MDGDEVSKSMLHELGMSLDAISVDELAERILLLEREIDRLKAEIIVKNKSKNAADAVFKF